MFSRTVLVYRLKFDTLAVLRKKMSSTIQDDVLFKECGKRGIITLNRAKQLNALNGSMVDKIYPMLKKWEKAGDKDAIIIKSDLEKAFCAGGDIIAVTKDKSGILGKAYFRNEYKNNGLIASLKTPYVALIRGIVMGGGVGLSIHGKYRVATNSSLFAMPETQIGLFPDVGVAHFLSRMPNHLGQFLALTGFRLKGYDLKHTKIATHFVHSCLWEEFEKELLNENSQWKIEDLLWEYETKSKCQFEGEQWPEFTLNKYIKTIDDCFSPKSVEEILAQLQKVDTNFTKELLALMVSFSPLSLKITLRHLEKAAEQNVYEVLNQDHRLAWRTLESCDFYEGVRALLVDKDKKPIWTPPTLEDVTNEAVEAFFCPLDRADELDLPRTITQE